MDKNPEKWTDAEKVRFLAVEGMGLIDAGGLEYHGDSIGIFMAQRTWNPLTDANDMLALIEAMVEKEWTVELFRSPEDVGWEAVLHIGGQHPDYDECIQFVHTADTAQRAVCLAACEALLAAKPECNHKYPNSSSALIDMQQCVGCRLCGWMDLY